MDERDRARGAVGRAVRDGVLVKPDACEECDRALKLDAHHHRGYDEAHALDVVWLCRRCHLHAERTPEQWSTWARNGRAKVPPERRSEIAHMGGLASAARLAKMTPDQRTALARAAALSVPPELRSANARAARARETPEQLAERVRRAWVRYTPEKRSTASRRGWETRRARAEARRHSVG